MSGDNAQRIDKTLENGMSFAMSNWSTTDNFLWKDRCQAEPCNSKQLLFKNIAITTGTPIHFIQ